MPKLKDSLRGANNEDMVKPMKTASKSQKERFSVDPYEKESKGKGSRLRTDKKHWKESRRQKIKKERGPKGLVSSDEDDSIDDTFTYKSRTKQIGKVPKKMKIEQGDKKGETREDKDDSSPHKIEGGWSFKTIGIYAATFVIIVLAIAAIIWFFKRKRAQRDHAEKMMQTASVRPVTPIMTPTKPSYD